MFEDKDSPSLVGQLTWFQQPCFILAFIFLFFDLGDFALPVKRGNVVSFGDVQMRIHKVDFIIILQVKIEHLLTCDLGMVGQLVEDC